MFPLCRYEEQRSRAQKRTYDTREPGIRSDPYWNDAKRPAMSEPAPYDRPSYGQDNRYVNSTVLSVVAGACTLL